MAEEWLIKDETLCSAVAGGLQEVGSKLAGAEQREATERDC